MTAGTYSTNILYNFGIIALILDNFSKQLLKKIVKIVCGKNHLKVSNLKRQSIV